MTSTPVLLRADCLDVLRTLSDCSVDSICTDPPYGLAAHRPERVAAALLAWLTGDREHVPDGRGFMGRAWDAFVPPPAVWDECLRVLRPGGHLACFAGSRTVDLMGLSIRLAGFEIRDGLGVALLAWVQGSGFPKGKQQLKPAWEPIILARKPLSGTVAATVLKHGTGALNIDGCRVGADSTRRSQRGTTQAWEGGAFSGDRVNGSDAGRWPTNVLFTHGEDCGEACQPGCAVAELDAQSGKVRSSGVYDGDGSRKLGKHSTNFGGGHRPTTMYSDSGGASRFFPVFRYQAKAPTKERPKIDGVGHPTVKPLALMEWLVTLVTPPGGLMLDPFAGTAPSVAAATRLGFAALGIERDEFAYRLGCQRLGLPVVWSRTGGGASRSIGAGSLS